MLNAVIQRFTDNIASCADEINNSSDSALCKLGRLTGIILKFEGWNKEVIHYIHHIHCKDNAFLHHRLKARSVECLVPVMVNVIDGGRKEGLLIF